MLISSGHTRPCPHYLHAAKKHYFCHSQSSVTFCNALLVLNFPRQNIVSAFVLVQKLHACGFRSSFPFAFLLRLTPEHRRKNSPLAAKEH